ncbi:MAG: phage portal protein [Lachnospiraceae bacterium]|nr:phage portal protein [Lachnospiraceae bacterium]
MIYRLPAGTDMTPGLLAEYIGRHKKEVNMRLKKLDTAYQGDYDIFHQAKKPAWKPDNRIAFGFAKYIVDTMNGYFLGTPVRVHHNDAAVEGFLELLSQYNDLDDINAELGKLSDIFGTGNEIYYADEDSKLCIQQVSPLESFMIYDDSVLMRQMYFVRYYRDSNNVERGSWSNDRIVQHFVRNGSYVWDGEPSEHYFDDVPASEFVENEERQGMFEGVMSAINAFNKALSEKANDVDAFADAYLKIIGPKISDGDIRFIRDKRIINLETEDVKGVIADFMQKQCADETQENLLSRLYKGIFQMTMVADLSDESFAGTSSGVALKFKLQAMSNLADTKKRKFQASLNRRYRILFSHPACTVDSSQWIGIGYTFTKNLPANLMEESQIATQLEGVVSKETQLGVLSIVDNVSKEMEKLDAESASSQSRAVI